MRRQYASVGSPPLINRSGAGDCTIPLLHARHAGAIDNAEFHDLVLQQPQGPARTSLRRFGTSQGNQFGFVLAIGYFWSMARDDRPWGSDDPPAVAYSYAPGRGAEHAIKLLAGYCGIVQCDGYAAYKQLLDRRRNSGPAALAFCWAHWRRRFYEIAKAGPAPIAQEALARMAALYAIEKRIRGRSAAERVAVRQAESKPLIDALKSWLESELRRVSGKSVIAGAIRYGLKHWDGLVTRRCPDRTGKVTTEVRTFQTTTADLLRLSE
jgi:hypothetical protein